MSNSTNCVRKRLPRVVLAICLILFAMWRCYRQFVPPGAKPTAYLFYSFDGGSFTSPDGTEYLVKINDAGAAHSGKHWTWVVKYHWLTGLQTVAVGYLEPKFLPYSQDPVPLTVSWDDNHPILPFARGRYESRENGQ